MGTIDHKNPRKKFESFAKCLQKILYDSQDAAKIQSKIQMGILSNVVIHKIINGHRSEDGAKAHKILMSIKETCRLRNLNFHDYLEEYLSNLTSKL